MTRPAFRRASLCAASAWACAAYAHAQTPPSPTPDPANEVEQVVVTGTKTADTEFGAKSGIPLERVPQSVQLLEAEDIAARGARSVGEALRAVPSANAGASRVSRYQSFSVKVRGFPADQMRNGVRQRYYEDVDASALSNIGRIEVLKGPSAVLFGQSAVGGLVSIVTKRPERTFGAAGSLTMGSYDQRAAAFDLTGPLAADLYGRLTGEVERSGTSVDFQDLDRENIALSLTWAPSDRLQAYLVAEYVERRTLNNPGLPLAGTVQPGPELPRERYLGEPSASPLEAFAPLVQAWADIGLGGGWTLTPRLSYSGFDTNFVQTRVLGLTPEGLARRNGRFGKEDDNYTIVQLDLEGGFRTGPLRHSLLAGVEYDRERGTFLQNTLTNLRPLDPRNPAYTFAGPVRPAFEFAFDFSSELDGTAVYLQDQVAVTPRWDVVLGLRRSEFDYSSRFNGETDSSEVGATTYQIGTTYRLSEQLAAFGGYNTGFDVENTAGSRSVTGEPFEPERSDQLEAGLRLVRGPVRGSLSAFRIRRFDSLTADPDNEGFSVQTGEVVVDGLELEGVWSPTTDWRLQGGYARFRSEIVESNDGDEGGKLGDVPEHQATVFAVYAPADWPWELRAGAAYVGERRLMNGSDVRLDAYATIDLGAAYDFGPVRAELLVTNAADERFFTPNTATSVYPGDPRQVSLRLSRSFGGLR